MLQSAQQQQQPLHTAANDATATETSREAPPKQVAMAMERLGEAARLIADIRLGADRLLEALFVSAQSHQPTKPLHLILKEETAMRQHLQDLRNIGRQLEDSGVLNEALLSRSNSWGLHMPLVCPDGAVVAYAWKRQLAGQAGSSAVDRTRLALKSFVEQKKRFFPHLDVESVSKRHCTTPPLLIGDQEEGNDYKTLSDILTCFVKEIPDMKVFAYERLEWLKRAASLPSPVSEGPMETSIGRSYHNANKLRPGTLGAIPADKVAVIELFIPSVLRAVVSLHPVGSTSTDAIAFFSPDEGGSYVHARGVSVYQVFRHITEYANMAVQYFLGIETETALYSLLQWVRTYQTLFTRACSKCGRVLSMDRESALFLPPVLRPYRKFSASWISSTLASDQSSEKMQAYHIGCSLQDM
ncbi:hypothetical protein Ancab_015912 [Ancistrocladus abbreviatus]